MSEFIRIEDLAAIALIELSERADRTNVSFEELEKYGKLVIKAYEMRGKSAALLMSRMLVSEFEKNYSDLFSITAHVIYMKNGIDSKDLRKSIRHAMTSEMIETFMDKKSLSAIGL